MNSDQSGLISYVAAIVTGDAFAAAVLGTLAVVLVVSTVAGRRARKQEALKFRIETVRIRAAEVDTWLDRYSGPGIDEEARPTRPLLSGLIADLAALLGALPIFGDKDRQKLHRTLVVAGFRTPDAVNLLLASKVLSGIASGLGVYVFAISGEAPMATGFMAFVFFIGGLIVGSLLPEFVLKWLANRQRSRIGRAVPDALDLLVICAEAGLTLDSGIQRVARELRHSAPEVARELAITEAELRVLSERREALENLVYRTDVPEFSSLVVTLVQAERYGTSLSQALRTIASESRRTRMLSIEERAARLPALMSLPLMLMVLPPVIVIVTGPAILRIMEALG